MATKEHSTSVTAAVEDYAKAIYALETHTDAPVSTNALAERLGVTAASASNMAKKLDEVLRHHRLLELYLAETLDVPWDRVHDEAEVLEHVLSEDLEELIARKLGNPTRDPHGDPIPTRDLTLDEGKTESMQSLEPGAGGTFVRISDSDPEMLRYLADQGIAPGDEFEVVEKQPFGGPVSARFGDQVLVLGGGLARAMRAEVSRR
jgi:DtxR family Mn-dependent transcriptional regulator